MCIRDRVNFISLASWSPGVVGIKMVVVKLSFPHLNQAELLYLGFSFFSHSEHQFLGTVFEVLHVLSHHPAHRCVAETFAVKYSPCTCKSLLLFSCSFNSTFTFASVACLLNNHLRYSTFVSVNVFSFLNILLGM